MARRLSYLLIGFALVGIAAAALLWREASHDDTDVLPATPVDVGYALLPPTPQLRPVAIAVSADLDRICWAEENANRLRCADRAGQAIQTVAELSRPQGVALDAVSRRLYWTSDGTYPRQVGWISLDAPDPAATAQVIAAGTDVNRPYAVAIHGRGADVVWSEAVSGRLRRWDASTATIEELWTSGFDVVDRPDARAMRALGLATLDDATLLWTDMARGTIERRSPEGQHSVVFDATRPDLLLPSGLAVDSSERHLYWSDLAYARIQRAAIDGSAVEPWLTPNDGLVEPRGLAFDVSTKTLYWVDAARDVIGRRRIDGPIEELALRSESAGFLTPSQPLPTACEQEHAELAAAAAARTCLEAVDAHQAVKVAASDVGAAAPACIATIHRVAAANSDVARCLGPDSHSRVRLSLHRQDPRAAWKIEEIRPFIAASTDPRAAVVVSWLDAWSAPADAHAASPAGIHGVSASGQRVAYGAHRRGMGIGTVPDDGTIRSGVPMRFVDHGDGTITDSATGLQWEKKCDGCGGLHDVRRQARWSSPHDETVWDWLDAVNAEEGRGFAGFRDWRLPNVKELQSIVDYDRFNPAVGVAFDGPACGLGCNDLSAPECSCTETSEYWTSTTGGADSDLAFYVGFHLGLIGDLAKSDDLPMRAVRGGIRSTEACRDPIDAQGTTPLLRAILANDTSAVRNALAAGGDVHCRVRLQRSALVAAGKALPEDITAVDADPLLVAAFLGNATVLEWLLSAGAAVESPAPGGHRSLHIASAQGNLEAIRTLLRAGADPDAAGEEGSTPLVIAAENGHLPCVSLLLEGGATVDRVNEVGTSPLTAAIEHGHVDVAAKLIDAGAVVEPDSPRATLTPLLLALARDDRAMVELLVERGADVARARRVDSTVLADQGFDIEGGMQIEITPLMLAAFLGNRALGEVLVERGADPRARNHQGLSALTVAVFTGNAEIAAWLIRRGADPNSPTQRGETPLLLAIDQEHAELVAALLAGGANPNLPDERGTYPLQAARESGNDEIAQLLERHGAQPGLLPDVAAHAAFVDTVGFRPTRVASRPPSRRPLGLAVDPDDGWLYWSEYGRHAIRRTRLEGGPVVTLNPGDTLGPISLALQPDPPRLYWTSDAAYPRRVLALDLNAPTQPLVVLAQGTLVNRPRAIATSGSTVVWSEAINGRIRSITTERLQPLDLVSDGISSSGDRHDFRSMTPLGLTVDSIRSRVFWTDISSSSIESCAFDGSDRRVERDGLLFPTGIVHEPTGDVLFWADAATSTIMRSPTTGGSPQVILGPDDGMIEPRALALDTVRRHIYWADVALDAIGRATFDGTEVAYFALDDGAATFVVPRPGATCEAQARQHVEREQRLRRKHLALCLEAVDALKAVRRRFDDLRRAVDVCSDQLAALHPVAPPALDACRERSIATAWILQTCGGPSPAGCADRACADEHCRVQAWRQVHEDHPRLVEWLTDLRPYLVDVARRSAEGSPDASEAGRAVAVLDEVLRTAATSVPVMAPNSQLPITGMTTSYRAIRHGAAAFAPVADDGAEPHGAEFRLHDNGDGTITDRNTGLMWEKKSDGGHALHDVDEAHPWSSEDRPTIWDWLDALNRDGGTGFAGYSDWRIPNVKELQSIVDYEVFNPAVRRAFQSDGCGLGCTDVRETTCSCTAMSAYWTSTTFADGPGRAMAVLFNLGLVGDRGKDEPAHVRAVRDALPASGAAPEATD